MTVNRSATANDEDERCTTPRREEDTNLEQYATKEDCKLQRRTLAVVEEDAGHTHHDGGDKGQHCTT